MIEYNSFIDSPFNDWQEIDIIVSRDCTLRCTYCYLQKNKDAIYDMDSIMTSLDSVLKTAYEAEKEGVVLSFYPEPWVNIQRTNELVKRSLEVLLKYDRFVTNYMIMMGTNGVNLHKPIPILKNLQDHLSLNVTIDGVKEQHDMYRLFPDGSPSWDIVRKNILDNQSKYNIYSTKVTLGPETLKYAYESSLFLWDEMHMKDINMNIVFENLWGDNIEKHLETFEQQLGLIVDDIIKNKRWEHMQYQGLVGHRHIPRPARENIVRTYCGAAMMRSIDSDGKIYPCFRLSPYALSEDKRFEIGKETTRALKLLNTFDATTEKCRQCELLEVCSMCVGGAVEESGSLYWRTTNHCEFQKLQTKYATKLYKAMNGEKDDLYSAY